ncbi:MAG TPA: hypothetical protein VIT90_13215 [Lysobacter sp.]
MRVLSYGSLWIALALVAPLHAGEVTSLDGVAVTAEPGERVVPVIWESPGCEHEKLGSVEVTVGEHVSEITQDPNVPTVEYGRAMAKLARAAGEKGANAVVLRWHQGVYFTFRGRKSPKPVFVKLRGAAIHLSPQVLAQCPLKPVTVADLEDRSRSGKPVNTEAREVFAKD